jgi:hypothetical protein
VRKPTPIDVLYDWHSKRISARSLADEAAPFVDDPQCGWYKRRLVKGGPFVPARIWIERFIDPETGELLSDEEMCCEVNGIAASAEEQWQWLWENPISEAEFRYMTALAYHVSFYEPDAAEANPKAPIDWAKIKPPSFNRRK